MKLLNALLFVSVALLSFSVHASNVEVTHKTPHIVETNLKVINAEVPLFSERYDYSSPAIDDKQQIVSPEQLKKLQHAKTTSIIGFSIALFSVLCGITLLTLPLLVNSSNRPGK